jgi:hypothetical protein
MPQKKKQKPPEWLTGEVRKQLAAEVDLLRKQRRSYVEVALACGRITAADLAVTINTRG